MALPQCPYFGTCGGCMLQHVDYEQQLEQKKNQLQALFNVQDIKVFAGQPYAYRNRMDFVFTRGGLGFREKNQWSKIVNVDHCPISNQHINNLLKEVLAHFKEIDYFDLKKQSGAFRHAVISAGTEASISFVLNEDSMKLKEAMEQIEAFSQKTSAEHVMVAYTKKENNDSTSLECFAAKGSEFITETLLNKTFTFHIQGFFQNNSAVAEQMHTYCRNLLKSYATPSGTLLDLYAGVGTFGIINADQFKEVFCIESFPSKEITDQNAEQNNINNLTALTMDAKALTKLKLPKELVVLTDPPRSGMDQKAIKKLLQLMPKAIIYISCNPQELAKELKFFKKHYSLESISVFDLFPQTVHVEAVAELKRRE